MEGVGFGPSLSLLGALLGAAVVGEQLKGGAPRHTLFVKGCNY